ncbi:outer membrane beta-barrel protein [Fibrella sp. USSR17]
MKTTYLLLALAIAPFSLSAQHKPAARKSSKSPVHHSAVRPATRLAPVHAPITGTNATAAKSVGVAGDTPVSPPTQVAARPEGTLASVPATQPVSSTKDAKLARVTKPVPGTPAKASPDRSQESSFRVGLRAGGSGATMSGGSADSFGGTTIEPVTGFHAGLVLSFCRRGFTIQPEILYSQYGFKVTAGADYVQIKYNLVEVPVMLKYTFGQSTMRFFVNAGPTATYLLNGTITIQEGDDTNRASLPIGPNDGRINYGGSLGLGVAMQAGTGSFQIEARGTYLKTSEGATSLQNAKLSVAYLLPLGRR